MAIPIEDRLASKVTRNVEEAEREKEILKAAVLNYNDREEEEGLKGKGSNSMSFG